ncbi:MAG: hypothetical protein KDD62_16590, partial [Bdellovibrionales bacterium]|nr:hypothetical protein [Bdellovibrionales bacterium]
MHFEDRRGKVDTPIETQLSKETIEALETAKSACMLVLANESSGNVVACARLTLDTIERTRKTGLIHWLQETS